MFMAFASKASSSSSAIEKEEDRRWRVSTSSRKQSACKSARALKKKVNSWSFERGWWDKNQWVTYVDVVAYLDFELNAHYAQWAKWPLFWRLLKKSTNFWRKNNFSRVLKLKTFKMCEKFGAKFQTIHFFRVKICIKSGFCNAPKSINVSHCVKSWFCLSLVSFLKKIFSLVF